MAALAVLMAACGDGGGDPPSVEALAAKLGCANVVVKAASAQRELGSREDGRCDFAGDTVQILIYNSNSARDTANDIAKEFGGIAVLGDRWTVRVRTDAVAEQVRAKLGGKLD